MRPCVLSWLFYSSKNVHFQLGQILTLFGGHVSVFQAGDYINTPTVMFVYVLLSCLDFFFHCFVF